jgi:hypothetical protein
MILFTCFAKKDRRLSKLLQYVSQRRRDSQYMVITDVDYRAGISRLEQMIADRQEPELDSEKDSLFNREILNKIEEGSRPIIELRILANSELYILIFVSFIDPYLFPPAEPQV